MKIVNISILDNNIEKNISEDRLKPSLVEVIVSVEKNNKKYDVKFKKELGELDGLYLPEIFATLDDDSKMLCDEINSDSNNSIDKYIEIDFGIDAIDYNRYSILEYISEEAEVWEKWSNYMKENYLYFDEIYARCDELEHFNTHYLDSMKFKKK